MSVCVCVCVCTHVFVYAEYVCMCACVYTHVLLHMYTDACENSSKPQLSFLTCQSPLTHPVLEIIIHWLFIGLELTKLGWLVSEPQRSACLRLPTTGITSTCHHAWFFCVASKIKFKTTKLHSKHFTDWVLSRPQGVQWVLSGIHFLFISSASCPQHECPVLPCTPSHHACSIP